MTGITNTRVHGQLGPWALVESWEPENRKAVTWYVEEQRGVNDTVKVSFLTEAEARANFERQSKEAN